MVFQVSTRFSDCLGDLVEDVHTSFFSLVQSTFQNFVRQTVYLDIHLSSSDTVSCSGYLEVHISEVVFVTEDVRQYSIFFFARILDQSHSNTRYRLLDLHTGIHQCQCSGTYGSHRRRTVRFEDFRNNTYYVWIVSRNLSFQGTPSQVTVTDFTTAYTTLSFCFTCRERREVIVQQETFFSVFQYIVDNLFVELRTQSDRSQRLSFTTSENSRSVRTGQRTNLTPDRADFSSLTTIQALAFVKN